MINWMCDLRSDMDVPNLFFSLICYVYVCSYMAKDVRPLPLAVDRRGLDDQLDLGQIAAPAAAGLPVHAAAVPYPL